MAKIFVCKESTFDEITASLTVSIDFLHRFFLVGNGSFDDTEIVESPNVGGLIEWIEAVLKNDKKRRTFTDKWELRVKEQAENKVLPFLKKYDNALLVSFFD